MDLKGWVTSLCDIPKTRHLDGAGPWPSLSCYGCGTASHTPTGCPSWIVSATVLPQLGRGPHLSLTQGDGSTALGAAVVLAVQPRLGTDVQLILSLVTNLGADTGFGDEVQALAVTAVITPCSRKTPTSLKTRGWSSAGLLCTHTQIPPPSSSTQDFHFALLGGSTFQRSSRLWTLSFVSYS